MASVKPTSTSRHSTGTPYKTATKQPQLSNEHVSKSDSESESDLPNSDEHSDSDSEGFESEGDEASTVSKSTQHRHTSKASTAPVNGVKRKAPHDTSESDSSSAGEHAQTSRSKKAKTGEQSLSGTRSPSESDIQQKQKHIKSRHNGTTQHGFESSNAETAAASKRFKPPSGFSMLEPANSQQTAIAREDLGSSNVWHIMAPTDVPLSLIHGVTQDSIAKGKPVLSNEGTRYILVEDETSEAAVFLALPGAEGYELVAQPITRTLNLQQMIELPALSRPGNGSSAAADVTKPSTSSVREQPKGLRMRYKPPGSGDNASTKTGAESDSESLGSRSSGRRLAFQSQATTSAKGDHGHGKDRSGKSKQTSVKEAGSLGHGDAKTQLKADKKARKRARLAQDSH